MRSDELYENYTRFISLNINKVLFDHYHRLGLNENSYVVLLKLIHFDEEKEGVNLSLIEKSTSLSHPEIYEIFQGLMQKGIIDVKSLKKDGKYIEELDVNPLYEKLNGLLQEGSNDDKKIVRDLFQFIENLYGRALGPNDYQRLNAWIMDDEYTPVQIKEAVELAYNNKITSMQYVERILSNSKRSHEQTKNVPMKSWLKGEKIDD